VSERASEGVNALLSRTTHRKSYWQHGTLHLIDTSVDSDNDTVKSRTVSE
jgi:hypothetical protein